MRQSTEESGFGFTIIEQRSRHFPRNEITYIAVADDINLDMSKITRYCKCKEHRKSSTGNQCD